MHSNVLCSISHYYSVALAKVASHSAEGGGLFRVMTSIIIANPSVYCIFLSNCTSLIVSRTKTTVIREEKSTVGDKTSAKLATSVWNAGAVPMTTPLLLVQSLTRMKDSVLSIYPRNHTRARQRIRTPNMLCAPATKFISEKNSCSVWGLRGNQQQKWSTAFGLPRKQTIGSENEHASSLF